MPTIGLAVRLSLWTACLLCGLGTSRGQYDVNITPDDFSYYQSPPEEPCCPRDCMSTDDGNANGSGCPPCEETGSVFFSLSLGRTGFERKTDFFRAAVAPSFAAPRPGLPFFISTSGMAHKVRTFEQVAAAYRRNPLTARREFRLWIAQDDIAAATYLPTALIADPDASAEKIVVSGAIRQVLTDDRLADIQSLSAVKSSLPADIQAALPSTSEGYVVRTWFAWDKGTPSGGLYTLPSGIDPLAYVIFYNPDAPADNGRLNIIHRAKYSATAYKTRSYTHFQDATTHDWTSKWHAGLPSDTVVRETFLDVTSWTSSRDFTRIRTVKEAALDPAGTLGGLQTIAVISENFDDIGGTSRLVEEIHGHGTAATRTTRYGYYDNTAETATLGRLKWRTEPDGFFVHYSYTFDSVAPSATIVKKTPWKSYKWNPATQPSGPTSSSCLVETSYMTPSSLTVTTTAASQMVAYRTESWATIGGGVLVHTRLDHTGSHYLTTATGYHPASLRDELRKPITVPNADTALIKMLQSAATCGMSAGKREGLQTTCPQ